MAMMEKMGKSNSENGEPPKKRPYMRVHNASIVIPNVVANILASEEQASDERGFSFVFPVLQPPYPDTQIEGFMRIRRFGDFVCIWLGAKHMRSVKEHAIVISPPEASKEEIIEWLRNENTWPLIEEKWWELYRDAEPD